MMSYTKDLVVGLVVILSLLHDGQTQTNPACRNRLDLLIVIDASGSVEFNNRYNWPQAKELTKGYLQSFNIGRGQVHVAIMQVSDQARIEHRFNSIQSQFEVFNVIDRLQYTRGATNLADAFDQARTDVFDARLGGARGDVQRVMILLSDGLPTVNVERTVPAANQLKQEQRVLIIPVGISAGQGGYNEALLRQIASDPNEPIVNYNQLQLTSQILTSQNLDIAIALDCSGSILFLDINNWWYAKLFLDYLVQALRSNNPGQANVRVATVLFNETATMAFNLERFTDTFQIIDAIRQLEYCGGKTNMAAAMRMVGQQVFRLNDPRTRPDPNRKRVLLLITDGVSTVEAGRVQFEANQLKTRGVEVISCVVLGDNQVDRTRLRHIASVISSRTGETLRPALVEVSDYASLGSKVETVVDRICSVPVLRSPEDDLRVECFSSCRNPLTNMPLAAGNYHYCRDPRNRLMLRNEDCIDFIHCTEAGIMTVIKCPPRTMFDESLKGCDWTSCSCPGNIRKCEEGVNILAVVVNGQRQINRVELAKLASIISERGTQYGPALIEVTNYRALGSQIRTVVDRICRIPIARLAETDREVSCYSSCINGRTPLFGFFQYCSNGVMSDTSECQRFLDCNGSGQTRFMNCPPNFEFDNGLKQCTWHSCTCPGNTRNCYYPNDPAVPGI